MIYRTSEEIIEAYYNDKSIPSQSALKCLIKSLTSYKQFMQEGDATEREKPYFTIGKGAELLAQYGEDAFNERYYVSQTVAPSEIVMAIMERFFQDQVAEGSTIDSFWILDTTIEKDFLDILKTQHAHSHNALLEVIQVFAYQPKWGADAKLKNVIAAGNNYYLSLQQSLGKQVISLDQFTTMQAIANSWLSNPKTSQYFSPEVEGVDYWYQFPIYFEYMGVEFKLLIDILKVDHKNQTVQVIDQKTMADPNVLSFIYAYKSYRYDFQGAFYSIGLKEFIKYPSTALEQSIGLSIKDYKVVRPLFIVETSAPGMQGNPLVFQMSPQAMNDAINGTLIGKTRYFSPSSQPRHFVETERVGINEAVELYKYYEEQGFQEEKVIRDAGDSPLQINWEGVE